MLLLGKRYGVDGVMKRASYEILSSEAFWEARVRNPESIRLTDGDVLQLYPARMYLGSVWRTFLLEPPAGRSWVTGEKGKGLMWCCGTTADERVNNWRSFMIEGKQVLQRETMDPVRKNDVGLWKEELVRLGWCEQCLEQKAAAWRMEREEWWRTLSSNGLA